MTTDIEVEVRTDNSELIISEMDAAVVRALTMIGMKAEANAKIEITKSVYNTPASSSYKRTGRLRNSLTWAVVDDSAYVGTNVEYAPYVELGTSRQRPKPYLKPAIMNHIEEYKAIVQKELSRG